MKISTQTIKFINQRYGSAGDPAPNGVDDLVQKIGAQLAAVEETVDFGARFNDAVVVKVVACEDHPNADRLHVCWIDDTEKTLNIERGENGLIRVVCGAPNVRAGMLAVWLPPGSTVPSTAGKEPFVLEAREIRGVKSNGMLASPKELSLGDSHEGILELADDDATPGMFFADAFHLRGDHIIDMENKMFTHRPDLFGYLGLARELEGIQRRPYKSPEWYKIDADLPEFSGRVALPLSVGNELPELVPRFIALAMSGVTVKPSPVWLQVDLARAGLRPVNNIVDYTNFYMLLTGQPLHAYDYDKVKALSQGGKANLVIRHPRKGEKITLLNGKQIEPREKAIMIATDKTLIGVGGVMGGADTEVDENTKNIILEAATFDMYSIRRTSMAHGIFTDAVTRFNKGQSPLQNRAVICKIADQIVKAAGGEIQGLADDNHLPEDVQKRGNVHPPVAISAAFVNDRLGWKLSAEAMKLLLTNVEFEVAINGDELTVTAPFWRTDIAIAEDIVEEIGRLYGYDHLPLDLPRRSVAPASKNPQLQVKSRIRDLLAQAGANEVLTYSFVHGNLLDKVGQNRELAFQLSNALSPDLQYFRLSLTPSLLEKVHQNLKAGFEQFALFELGKVHAKGVIDDDDLPKELSRVALVFTAGEKTAGAQYSGAPYYQARKYLMTLLAQFGLVEEITFVPLAEVSFGEHPAMQQMLAPFEPHRSAALMCGERLAGVVGEYQPGVIRALKLPAFTAGFELFLSTFHDTQHAGYVQLPRFPSVSQDLCLRLPAQAPYQTVFDFVMEHLNQRRPDATYHTLGPVDIYQRQDDAAHKQITLRLTIASYDRTLTDNEVNELLNSVAAAAKESLNAERV